MSQPSFLDLPARPAKPRLAGLTCVIDGGIPIDEAASILLAGAPSVDVWKMGWGSSYLDAQLADRLDLLVQHAVMACPGGTLLEVASLQGRTAECLSWMVEVGFPCIEVSDGLGRLDAAEKAALIAEASRHAIVIAEVGAKDPTSVLTPKQWAHLAQADLDAGATWVLAEGRESGTVGIFDPDGRIRTDVIDALLTVVEPHQVVFEAPRKDQQAWFIRHLGSNVNLANVAPRDALGLEALRLGLRADTTMAILGQPANSQR
jgi:phosphosulfolactate synthase